MKKISTFLLMLVLMASASQAQLRYAGRVIGASREYHNFPDGWAAFQMLGVPDVYPTYGDYGGSWSPLYYGDQRDWLELEFDNAGPVDSIYIYETNTIGFIDTVYVQNPGNNAWIPVYSHTAAFGTQVARILRIGFQPTTFNVSRVRIALATDQAPSYPEIDAVALHPASHPNLVLSNTIGTAVSLDGVDDIFQTNTPLRQMMDHTFTIMAWVKPVGPANNVAYGQYGGGIVGDSYHSIFAITVANTGSGDSLYMMTLGSASGVVTMPYVTGNWMHIAMVQTADSLIGYQNGVRMGAVLATAPAMDYYSLSLGRNDDGGAHFAGQIDEFKTFTSELTAAQVAQQQNLIGYPALTSELRGYWQFNEASGTGHFNSYNHITDSLLFGASYVSSGVVVGTEPQLQMPFDIYPNPSNGQVFVRGDFHAINSMQVVDLAGKVLWSRAAQPTATTQQLDLSQLPAGMYLLRLQSKQAAHTQKIVLN
jgi:Concanavalin A-like lectin/glucanases superfamily/Secretion system C-terminal sorting domain